MKRFSSPQILGAMGYPSQEKKNRRNNMVYSAEFQAMLDGLDDNDDYDDPDCAEEISGQEGTDKKRRLRFDQVKALEKIFEVDNKLEPERKFRIAEELGLQPRQVAVWFQNRRARWKTKQLERDYGLLRANYEALKVSYDKLEKDTQALTAELKELAEKLGEENDTDSPKETEINKNVSDQLCLRENDVGDPDDYEVGNKGKLIEMEGYVGFNEEISNRINPQLLLSAASSNSFVHEYCSSSMRWMNCIQLLDSRAVQLPGVPPKGYPRQFVKMEEQSLSSAEEEEFSRIHFSVDQAPTLYWQH